MTRNRLTVLAALATGAAAAFAGNPPPPSDAPLLGTKDYLARPAVPADGRWEYGEGASRFADLYLPKTGRPLFRLVVFFHGGCWMSRFGLESVGGFCRALADEAGVAVLSVEYRRVGEEGGGWPGTFLDAAAALDWVETLATRAPVSRENVTVSGHSAGGHLALWLAARSSLPAGDPLRTPVRVRPARVVALAPIADLRDAPATACAGVLEGLLGPASLLQARLGSASPAARLPLGVPQVLLAGGRDPIVPLATTRAYAGRARAAGDDVSLVEVSAAGHFELVTPGSSAWSAVVEAFRAGRPAGEGRAAAP
jgi:acetyl esterase/lipase